MSELVTLLLGVLGVFGLALAVRLLVRNRDRIAFANMLVFIGVAVSLGLDLTSELILTVFLPAIIF